jgi:hypothetical protein
MRLVIGAYAGIAPKLVPKGAANYGDFVAEESPLVDGSQARRHRVPGTEASLPIARMVEGCAKAPASKKRSRTGSRNTKASSAFLDLSDEEKAARIAADPEYGGRLPLRNGHESRNPQSDRKPARRARRDRGQKPRPRDHGRCNGGYA